LEGNLDDISVVDVFQPMTETALAAEIRRVQAERSKEIAALESEIDGMTEEERSESDIPGRLAALRAITGAQDAEKIMSKHVIKVALRSVSRRQAFRRSAMIADARKWFYEKTGIDPNEVGLEDRPEVPDEIGQDMVGLIQAADIMAAIVPEKCEGWDVPKSQEEWLDAPDWLFTRVIAETYALNPQFTLAYSGEF